MLLLIDNYDSFTFNLYQYLSELGAAVEVHRNDQISVEDCLSMAPEQVDPKAFVDHLADIYGLGALMYARMTCQPPFKGKTPEETLAMIRKAKLLPPSEHQEAIPEELDDVVMKMLARRQEDRYSRISDVLSELETIAEEQEVEV